MDFTIRPATLKDFRQLRDLYQELDVLHAESLPAVFKTLDKPATRKNYLAAALSDGNTVLLVAENSDGIVGVVHASIRDAPDYPVFVPRKYAWVESLSVRGDFRRYGVGRALMKQVEAWAAEKGIAQVELNVWEFNEKARAFYESLGYETASRRMWKALSSGKNLNADKDG